MVPREAQALRTEQAQGWWQTDRQTFRKACSFSSMQVPGLFRASGPLYCPLPEPPLHLFNRWSPSTVLAPEEWGVRDGTRVRPTSDQHELT